ncbi:hypothetical protein BDK51DRAFT_49879 [Blyttiomyces helicus]|uniref:Uncharacterized protein n=1 Tax=Blyttiomyces helicus TaxID=388810 RepID=A0A4P9W8B0_9FUNG|nr:hypothetical protein BDK51DRAFT_49879 [Blyttiomyces helicus]|eukprot:RKO88761.1 hypothetical protein BDK51DRAFT_49879 [Blyttiomyces helicus]
MRTSPTRDARAWNPIPEPIPIPVALPNLALMQFAVTPSRILPPRPTPAGCATCASSSETKLLVRCWHCPATQLLRQIRAQSSKAELKGPVELAVDRSRRSSECLEDNQPAPESWQYFFSAS